MQELGDTGWTVAGTVPRCLGLVRRRHHRREPGLEIGYGTGFFTEMFAASGARIVAVDLSAELLAKARSRNLPSPQVSFCEKRFEDCDAEGPFDAIIGSSVLPHLDVDQAIRRTNTLLKKGLPA